MSKYGNTFPDWSSVYIHYIAHSMIVQRSGSIPMGRRRGILGANNDHEQEVDGSVNTTISIANGHHNDPLPTPYR